MMKSQAIDIEKQSQREIIDIETLEKTNRELLDTISGVLNVQQEGRESGAEIARRLAQAHRRTQDGARHGNHMSLLARLARRSPIPARPPIWRCLRRASGTRTSSRPAISTKSRCTPPSVHCWPASSGRRVRAAGSPISIANARRLAVIT